MTISDDELVASLEAAGRSEDVRFFTGGARLRPGQQVPEPFEMVYADGRRVTHFAGVIESTDWPR